MKRVEVDLALLEYPDIKKHIGERFRVIGRFNPSVGRRGDVMREVCLGSDCGYLAKIVKSGDWYAGTVNIAEPTVYNSIFLSEFMSSAGIGPVVYDTSLDNGVGTIVMKKYDGTLAELLFLYQSDLEGMEDSMSKVMDSLTQLVHKMHSYGVLHNDLTPANIFYLTNGTIVIGDYGEAIYFGPGSVNFRDDPEMVKFKQLIQIDLNHLDHLKNIYERIRGGEVFYGAADIQLEGYSGVESADVFVDYYFNGYETTTDIN